MQELQPAGFVFMSPARPAPPFLGGAGRLGRYKMAQLSHGIPPVLPALPIYTAGSATLLLVRRLHRL